MGFHRAANSAAQAKVKIMSTPYTTYVKTLAEVPAAAKLVKDYGDVCFFAIEGPEGLHWYVLTATV